MEILRYPLLCWKMTRGIICGKLVTGEYEVVASNVKKIKSMISDRLTKERNEWGYQEPELLQPRLKTIKVKVRPAYKAKEGQYPISKPVIVPVHAVYGENEHGFFECFLPLLREKFFFYDVQQLTMLVEHFSQNKFKDLTPEQVYRYFLPAKPWLEEVTLRGKVRETKHHVFDMSRVATLGKIAEKFPYTKNVRRKISALPEAAWEQATNVDLVSQKIGKEQANLLIVGEHGVGKSTILNVALRKLHNSGKGSLNKLTFWRTSAHRITAGAKYLGDWEEICEDMVDDLQRVHGVLWIDGFVDMLRIGGEGAQDSLAAFLASYLQQGRLQIISEVTPRELDSVYNLLPGFAENFQTIHIKELEQNLLFKVLRQFTSYVREKMSIEIDTPAIESCYRLLARFNKYESFPGKALQFLSLCLNDAYLKERTSIERMDVVRAFAQKTGMAELFLRDDVLLDKKELEQFFAKRIIGQPQALKKICSVVKVFKAGLNDPGKPIATMLFAGPTGVGKTASARALADYFFGKGQQQLPLIRLDMSEFPTPAHISRLIGVAGGKPGKLVSRIREKPFSVVLFDEIEKADSSIFDALLTVLDEGMLIDTYGRTTDFRNAIIIMTSNLGADAGSSIGFSAQHQQDYDTSIKSFFRPEFYNRLDAIVTFSPLSLDVSEKITKKELHEIGQREGLRKKNIDLEFSPELLAFLVQRGFDERYGARPLQRVIERHLVSCLAKFLLRHRKLHDCCLTVDIAKGKVIIH